MMRTFHFTICLALLAGSSVAVTPIEKVITLLEGLKDEVESDAKIEGKAYDEFACFCKDETTKKSDSVNAGEKKINVLSADIADKTQEKADDSSELLGRKKDQEELNVKLQETNERCAKEKAEYEVEAADLSKAIQGLKDAIKSMKESKPSLLSIQQKLGKTFEMADAMSLLKTPKHKAVAAFIQQTSSVDPSDPEYKFHSNDIIDVCENLLVDYKATKKTLDEEWEKTRKGCEELKKSLKKQLKANKDAMDDLVKNIAKLKEEIAQHREDLITADELMKDDQLYLKDLQARCEDRANDFDQRAAMRNDEVAALTSALEILKGTVTETSNEVNKRALLQYARAQQGAKKVDSPVTAVSTASSTATLKAISFLQDSSSNDKAQGFLALTENAMRDRALDFLKKEGQRIHSVALTSLATRVSADPFKKVKGLIQKLIERLLTEAKNEATKKGFCDTELGKARKNRDFRYTESKDLSADLASLEAKRDELIAEIKDLQKTIKEVTQALKEATEQREEEKKANMKTLKTAKEGLAALNEALLTLRVFYKQAAKAAFVQASPVDEDTKGPGFSGNYKGKQSGMKAIFALLETMVSDFDRTHRTTEEAEHNAHRDYVEFSQTAKSTIAGSETKLELDQQDLKTTRTSLKTKMDDLQTAVDLLDSALETIEELKPTCIDTGMSYKERVAKREDEIKALEKALEILAPQ